MMKPPLFIECSVCGREFGSKSIQIHEPQCLQKLRRTEIAQQESTTPPSTKNNNKSTRRRKTKTSERSKVLMGTRHSSDSTRFPGTLGGGGGGGGKSTFFGHSQNSPHQPQTINSAPSFVIMSTTTTATSTNYATTIQGRFNLPKIQPVSGSSSTRPSTAVLDRPRILNPEYIQYDMSLTRIDFTGHHQQQPPLHHHHHQHLSTKKGLSSTTNMSGMDENLNSNGSNIRIQRQNTQILDTPTRRHDFALPNVPPDANMSVVTPGTQKYQPGKFYHRSTDQNKLLPTGNNIMTTVDSILGDPQRNNKQIRGIGDRDVGNNHLTFQTGKFWDDEHDDDALHPQNTHTTASTTLMSLWSQEVYLLNSTAVTTAFSSSSQIVLPQYSQIPLLPPILQSSNQPDENDLPCPENNHSVPSLDALPFSVPPDPMHPPSNPAIPPSIKISPPVESLFASPNFPFFAKMSQCDLEKPLRTCFHLDKIPGHRHEFEPHQDQFVTPSASYTSAELPQVQPPPQQQQQWRESQQPTKEGRGEKSTIQGPVPESSVTFCRNHNGEQEGNYHHHKVNVNHEAATRTDQQERSEFCGKQPHKETSSNESLIKFDSFVRHEFGATATQETQRQSEEVVILMKNNLTNPGRSSSQQAFGEFSAHNVVDTHNHRGEQYQPQEAQREQGASNWIGEPFMQKHVYYSAPFIKDRRETTDTENESHYATPLGESQDDHELENANNPNILGAIQELKALMERKSATKIKISSESLRHEEADKSKQGFRYEVTDFPSLQVKSVEGEAKTPGLSPDKVRKTVLCDEKAPSQQKIAARRSSDCTASTPDLAAADLETEISEGIHSDGDAGGGSRTDYYHGKPFNELDESANSGQTLCSHSSGNKCSAGTEGLNRRIGFLPVRMEKPGSDADDESCDSQLPDHPDNIVTTIRSKSLLSKRHKLLRRKNSLKSHQRDSFCTLFKGPSNKLSSKPLLTDFIPRQQNPFQPHHVTGDLNKDEHYDTMDLEEESRMEEKTRQDQNCPFGESIHPKDFEGAENTMLPEEELQEQESDLIRFKHSAENQPSKEFPQVDSDFENMLTQKLFVGAGGHRTPVDCGTTDSKRGVDQSCSTRRDLLILDKDYDSMEFVQETQGYTSDSSKGRMSNQTVIYNPPVVDELLNLSPSPVDHSNYSSTNSFHSSSGKVKIDPSLEKIFTIPLPSERPKENRGRSNRVPRRRPVHLRDRPQTPGCIEDKVDVWEGSNVINHHRSSEGDQEPLISVSDEYLSQNDQHLAPRPPTRRKTPTSSRERRNLRSRISSSSNNNSTISTTPVPSQEKRSASTKDVNTKIEGLLLNLHRVGELQRERDATNNLPLFFPDITKRPQTSPAFNSQYSGFSPASESYRNRPSTSLPMYNAGESGNRPRKAKTGSGKTKKSKTVGSSKNKRSLSQSATPHHCPNGEEPHSTASSWKKSELIKRPVTATTIKFSTSSGNSQQQPQHSMTVRTALIENSRNIHKELPLPSARHNKETKYPGTEDEPLELLFSFKSKPPLKRVPSPMSLIPPQPFPTIDKAALYKQIELHRKIALSEAQKLLTHQRSSRRRRPTGTTQQNVYDSSTTPMSSASSTPKRIPSPPKISKAKKKLSQLRMQDTNERDNNANPIFPTIPRKEQGRKSIPSSPKEYHTPIPVPMSKRVHFSSPIQSGKINKSNGSVKKPRVTVPLKTSNKQFKTANSQTVCSPRKIKKKSEKMEDGKKQYTFSFKTSPNSEGRLKLTYRKKSKVIDDDRDDVSGEDVRRRKAGSPIITQMTHHSQSTKSFDTISGTGRDAELPPDDAYNQYNKMQEKENTKNILEKLEGMRDSVRGKEFERRKRGKGDKNNAFDAASISHVNLGERDGNDNMVDVKIIVRRKNKDGNYPPLDDAVGSFSKKFIYLIVDEEPLTRTSPNPYVEPHASRAKPRADDPFTLKITTSDQSTVDSLPSAEALNRFLTCYVCGQTLNVRDYFQHEKNCVEDVNEKNKYLAEEDKKILPQKPQGTITIKHWNEFAHNAIKNKFIRCPYCNKEFFPDREEDMNEHKESCTNRPPPAIPPSVGLNINEYSTVQMADEASGWIVPTAKELRQNTWNRGAGRVDAYTRPAAFRLKKYKKRTPPSAKLSERALKRNTQKLTAPKIDAQSSSKALPQDSKMSIVAPSSQGQPSVPAPSSTKV